MILAPGLAVNGVDELVASERAWSASRRELPRWEGLVRHVAAAHGLNVRTVTPFPTGSAVVMSLDEDAVIKVVAPRHRADLDREGDCFELAASLPCPLPRVLARGEVELLPGGEAEGRPLGEALRLPYLIMTRLSGRSLAEVWPELAPEEQVSLLQELGRIVRALHDLPPPAEGPCVLDWAAHRREQIASAPSRQSKRGLAEGLVRRIPAYLDAHLPPREGPPVLLHTEIMRDHVLVDRNDDGPWRVTGLFDFAEAITGPREYEFAAVGLFVSEGAPRLLRAFLDGYGFAEAGREGLPERLLAYTLLHRYAHLPWYMERIPPEEGAHVDLPALARRWFSL